ncbi:MAG: transcriptional repressor [Desulfomonilaceae bacterium]|nr:transcriptional repressor [Desulfomonilaceae bacterium]
MERQLRNTQQRRVILEELERVATHPTAGEIYQLVRKRLPRISLGTVYRNLEILSHAGKIRTIEFAGMEKRFDGITDDHYHVRCVKCGKIDDVPIRTIPQINEAVNGKTDYEILGHRLEFVGVCAGCTKRNREAP